MKTFDRNNRGFYWSSRAYYAQAAKCEHEIMFGLYPNAGDEGTEGEMAMRWIRLDNKWCPKLECFNDVFEVLLSFPDLIYELAKVDGTDFSEEEFVTILKTCGFRDFTKYESPYSKMPETIEQ